jgi:hypothetical protein
MLRKWWLASIVSVVSVSAFAPETEACCLFKLCRSLCCKSSASCPSPCPPAPAPAPAPPPPTPQATCCVAYWDANARGWRLDPKPYTAPQAQTRVAQLKARGYSAYSRYY